MEIGPQVSTSWFIDTKSPLSNNCVFRKCNGFELFYSQNGEKGKSFHWRAERIKPVIPPLKHYPCVQSISKKCHPSHNKRDNIPDYTFQNPPDLLISPSPCFLCKSPVLTFQDASGADCSTPHCILVFYRRTTRLWCKRPFRLHSARKDGGVEEKKRKEEKKEEANSDLWVGIRFDSALGI